MTLWSAVTLFLAVSTASAHRLGSSRKRRQQTCQRDSCVYFKDFNPTILETEFRCISSEDCELDCLYSGTSFVCEEDLIGTAVDVCSLACVTNGREECLDNKMCLPLSTVLQDGVVTQGCVGPDVCQGGECRYDGTAKTLMCDTSEACRSSEGLNVCCELPCVEPDSPVIPVVPELFPFKNVLPVASCESYKMCYPLSAIPNDVNREACLGPEGCPGGECRYNTDAKALQCDDGLLLCQYDCVEPDGETIPLNFTP